MHLIYIMELKYLNLRFLIYLAKKIQLFVHSAFSVLPTVQNNKQIFGKTWHSLKFNFTIIMKCNLENRIFNLCPNVAGFLNDKSEHI